MRTVAEGIQTETQARALVEMGCEQGQGYYFSRPLPSLELERLLRGETKAQPPSTTRSRARSAAQASG
jgi:EAL domain-containing protein (putative c-di-GMP-specific phosphodiesterase class I)